MVNKQKSKQQPIHITFSTNKRNKKTKKTTNKQKCINIHLLQNLPLSPSIQPVTLVGLVLIAVDIALLVGKS